MDENRDPHSRQRGHPYYPLWTQHEAVAMAERLLLRYRNGTAQARPRVVPPVTHQTRTLNNISLQQRPQTASVSQPELLNWFMASQARDLALMQQQYFNAPPNLGPHGNSGMVGQGQRSNLVQGHSADLMQQPEENLRQAALVGHGVDPEMVGNRNYYSGFLPMSHYGDQRFIGAAPISYSNYILQSQAPYLNPNATIPNGLLSQYINHLLELQMQESPYNRPMSLSSPHITVTDRRHSQRMINQHPRQSQSTASSAGQSHQATNLTTEQLQKIRNFTPGHSQQDTNDPASVQSRQIANPIHQAQALNFPVAEGSSLHANLARDHLFSETQLCINNAANRSLAHTMASYHSGVGETPPHPPFCATTTSKQNTNKQQSTTNQISTTNNSTSQLCEVRPNMARSRTRARKNETRSTRPAALYDQPAQAKESFQDEITLSTEICLPNSRSESNRKREEFANEALSSTKLDITDRFGSEIHNQDTVSTAEQLANVRRAIQDYTTTRAHMNVEENHRVQHPHESDKRGDLTRNTNEMPDSRLLDKAYHGIRCGKNISTVANPPVSELANTQTNNFDPCNAKATSEKFGDLKPHCQILTPVCRSTLENNDCHSQTVSKRSQVCRGDTVTEKVAHNADSNNEIKNTNHAEDYSYTEPHTDATDFEQAQTVSKGPGGTQNTTDRLTQSCTVNGTKQDDFKELNVDNAATGSQNSQISSEPRSLSKVGGLRGQIEGFPGSEQPISGNIMARCQGADGSRYVNTSNDLGRNGGRKPYVTSSECPVVADTLSLDNINNTHGDLAVEIATNRLSSLPEKCHVIGTSRSPMKLFTHEVTNSGYCADFLSSAFKKGVSDNDNRCSSSPMEVRVYADKNRTRLTNPSQDSNKAIDEESNQKHLETDAGPHHLEQENSHDNLRHIEEDLRTTPHDTPYTESGTISSTRKRTTEELGHNIHFKETDYDCHTSGHKPDCDRPMPSLHFIETEENMHHPHDLGSIINGNIVIKSRRKELWVNGDIDGRYGGYKPTQARAAHIQDNRGIPKLRNIADPTAYHEVLTSNMAEYECSHAADKEETSQHLSIEDLSSSTNRTTLQVPDTLKRQRGIKRQLHVGPMLKTNLGEKRPRWDTPSGKYQEHYMEHYGQFKYSDGYFASIMNLDTSTASFREDALSPVADRLGGKDTSDGSGSLLINDVNNQMENRFYLNRAPAYPSDVSYVADEIEVVSEHQVRSNAHGNHPMKFSNTNTNIARTQQVSPYINDNRVERGEEPMVFNPIMKERSLDETILYPLKEGDAEPSPCLTTDVSKLHKSRYADENMDPRHSRYQSIPLKKRPIFLSEASEEKDSGIVDICPHSPQCATCDISEGHFLPEVWEEAKNKTDDTVSNVDNHPVLSQHNTRAATHDSIQNCCG